MLAPLRPPSHPQIAFFELNNGTKMEILGGEPDQPSWWRDIYLERGYVTHHMGYNLPQSAGQIWPVVQAFTAGCGANCTAVQWGRWGTIDTPGAGCYVYVDARAFLGLTVEILASDTMCDSLPAQPAL